MTTNLHWATIFSTLSISSPGFVYNDIYFQDTQHASDHDKNKAAPIYNQLQKC